MQFHTFVQNWNSELLTAHLWSCLTRKVQVHHAASRYVYHTYHICVIYVAFQALYVDASSKGGRLLCNRQGLVVVFAHTSHQYRLEQLILVQQRSKPKLAGGSLLYDKEWGHTFPYCWAKIKSQFPNHFISYYWTQVLPGVKTFPHPRLIYTSGFSRPLPYLVIHLVAEIRREN